MNYKKKFQINKFNKSPILFSDSRKIKNITALIKNLPAKSIIIIRHYNLAYDEKKSFAQEIIKLAHQNHIKVLIAKDIKLANEVKADGIHFSDFDKLPIKFRRKSSFKNNFIFSISCHNQKNLLKYQKLKTDMVFLSPIFKTTSHIEAKVLGLTKLAKIASKYKNQSYNNQNLFVLGGINTQNLKKIQHINKQTKKISGFGGIDYFLGDA